MSTQFGGLINPSGGSRAVVLRIGGAALTPALPIRHRAELQMAPRRKAAAAMLGLLPLFPCLFLLSRPDPCFSSDEEGTVVLTTSGPIRGKRLPVGSSSVTAFLGVPYAQPPLGPLRFQKPLPHQPWSDILEATSFGHACPQPSFTDYTAGKVLTPKMPQSEDCLFLNVWVPHPRPPVPAPILVWIHPGGFHVGAASLKIHDGRFLAAYGKMIVVSMNYRLGALSGQGTGGSAVGFHLLSPGSRFLFTRAVLQSGSPTSPGTWTSLQEAQERGRRLGQLMGCANSNDTALVGCLQGKEAEGGGKQKRAVFSLKDLAGLPFLPTPDGDFLTNTPPQLLQVKQRQPMPIATGFTPNEGSSVLHFDFPDLNLDNASNVGLEQLLQVVRLVAPGEEAFQAVAQRYSQEGASQGEARYRWAMEQILGDYFIVCPVAEVARQEAEAAPQLSFYT
nr:cholinesterase-like [Pelodiscus sinensis]|eukprot:XP_025035808.1 cholinesterase-like [Pelodiscus sinensis]